jgi:RimJ/RimL family protein N-acetyltransferase
VKAINTPHPLLPEIVRHYEASELGVFGQERGPAFYEMCHLYAQSLWCSGYPAKCILLLNRALSCTLPATELIMRRWPLPYQALAWLMIHRPAVQFIGNPRRHWQHLATRMVEPNKELRTWRAWACWYLAKEILPEASFPADLQQIREEGVCEPTYADILEGLAALSPADDVTRWQEALDWSREQLGKSVRHSVITRIRRIAADELPLVQKLAHRIWPQCYPGIITDKQIDYMLSIWYQPDAMAREMEQRGVWYALIEAVAYGAVGYVSFERYPSTDICFINKLYLLTEMHGLGLGAAALQWTAARAKEVGCDRLQLRVNRANITAIRAYQRAGFTFVEDICTDIGSGFVMDDYRMEKVLKPVVS